MSNKSTANLPYHLATLLEPAPSGVTKLIAAWDGLNTESQILILMELDKAQIPAYLNKKIRAKALESTNPYVRYLAVRGYYFSYDDSDKAIKQRIEEDPDPLVRYCLLESEWNFLDHDLKDADAFFALPHEARLAQGIRVSVRVNYRGRYLGHVHGVLGSLDEKHLAHQET